jgi:hypothetical protein
MMYVSASVSLLTVKMKDLLHERTDLSREFDITIFVVTATTWSSSSFTSFCADSEVLSLSCRLKERQKTKELFLTFIMSI